MRFAIAAALLLAGIESTLADHPAGCEERCVSCGKKVCCLEVGTKPITKHCFEVECREICIPPVLFPWMKCCQTRPGKVRTIRVLKKHEYKVERCEYIWRAQPLCEQCRAAGVVPEACVLPAVPTAAPAKHRVDVTAPPPSRRIVPAPPAEGR